VLFVIKKYPADIGALGGIKRIREFSMVISDAYKLVVITNNSINFIKNFIFFPYYVLFSIEYIYNISKYSIFFLKLSFKLK
jgi:hypothetical protein